MRTLYDELVKELKEHEKTIKDIKFVTSCRDYEENRFNIPIDEFLKHIKEIEPVESGLNMLVVGKDFWLTSDVESEGYFDFISIPQKAKRTINVAKELLMNSEIKDPFILLGLKEENEYPE